MSDDKKLAEIRARHEEGVRAGADEDRAWLLAEVERLRKGLRQGFPIHYETAAGCLCPAGANASCQNSFCPRRNPPGVTCGGGRS
jgi:hypothetical protein